MTALALRGASEAGLRVGGSVVCGLLLVAQGAAAQAAEREREPTARRIEEIRVEGRALDGREANVGKTGAPLTEMPFSVSVLDNAFLRVSGAKTIQDALGYAAGVTSGQYGVDSRGDWSTVRGTSPVMYVDGLKRLFGAYNTTRPHPYMLEQVEILKGPSSVLYGQGTSGGIVNLVSKRPREAFGGEVFLEGGSFERRVVGADVTGALDGQGQWLGRLVGYYRDADHQVDNVSDDVAFLAPSLTWRPTPDTRLTMLGHIERNESGTTAAFYPWQGTVLANAHGQIPPDRFLSEPEWDRYDTERDAVTLTAEHRFGEVWRLQANVRYEQGTADYRSMWPIFTGSGQRFEPDGRTVQRTAYVSEASLRTLVFDLRAQADFATGPVAHELMMGLDRQYAVNDNDTWYGSGGPIDVFEPVYGDVPTGYTLTDVPSTHTEQIGFYMNDRLRWGRWIASAGGRYDEAASQTEGATVSDDADAVTLRAGLMYELAFGLTPYVSYTESFEPVAGSTAAGETFEPVAGEQLEAGLKYAPEGSNLLVTASYYDIVQRNRLTSDPLDPIRRIQSGEVNIDGVELELKAAWQRVNVLASFSHLDGESSASDVSSDLAIVPENELSGWVMYRFPGLLSGFRAGMGVRYVGESLAIPARIRPPDRTLYDAMLGYEHGSWRIDVNARNLTDNTHVTSCLTRGDCYYGGQRYLTADVQYKF